MPAHRALSVSQVVRFGFRGRQHCEECRMHADADRVLRVGWQDIDAVLTRQRKHIGAAGNQRLLVGQADVLARLDGRHRWMQARAPYCSHLPAQCVSRNHLCMCQAPTDARLHPGYAKKPPRMQFWLPCMPVPNIARRWRFQEPGKGCSFA